MESKQKDKGVYWFSLSGGIILFLFGLSLLIKNFFVIDKPNGYEIVFGIEFIGAGYYFVHEKFKGFNFGSASQS